MLYFAPVLIGRCFVCVIRSYGRFGVAKADATDRVDMNWTVVDAP